MMDFNSSMELWSDPKMGFIRDEWDCVSSSKHVFFAARRVLAAALKLH